jgi:hypothetical protein
VSPLPVAAPVAMFSRARTVASIRQYQYIYCGTFLSRTWSVEVMRTYHLPLCWHDFFIGQWTEPNPERDSAL